MNPGDAALGGWGDVPGERAVLGEGVRGVPQRFQCLQRGLRELRAGCGGYGFGSKGLGLE